MRKIAMLLVVAFLMSVVMPVFAGQPKIVINGLNSGGSASSQSSSESGVTPAPQENWDWDAPTPSSPEPRPTPEPRPYTGQSR